MGVPSITRVIDDSFTHTWYEIKAEATDNILDANVITAALRERGCFKTQTGGQFITDTISYGEKTASDTSKGSVLSSGEDDIETMARWEWKYAEAHVQRSLQDDQVNQGPAMIKKLVATKIKAMREAMNTKIESDLTAAIYTSGTAAEIIDLRQAKRCNSLFNVVPGIGSDASDDTYNAAGYKFGEITRDNTWWQPKYVDPVEPANVNLLANMKTLYNTIGNNQEFPNLILTNQTLFEIYEDFALDAVQLVRGTTGSHLVDLGFEVLMFKGKPLVWTNAGSFATNKVLMLNTNYLRVNYDPSLWFEMTGWKDIPLQAERIAHIFIAWQLTSDQLRRHGVLGDYA